MTGVNYKDLSSKRPLKSLVKRLRKSAGRNSQGRITVRHKGGGNKRLYRMVDFKRSRLDVQATVQGIEYDPYRTAFIARIEYDDGKKSYILACDGLKVGSKVVSSEKAPLKTGNRLKLKNIPVGYRICNVEIKPDRGGGLARSAGSYVEILAQANGYTDLKMPSSEIRKVPWGGYATLGQISNPAHNLTTIGKAGRSRWLGIRPTVRGSAMNPVDHPYGGGEGRTQRGLKRPKTKWGKVTGGHRTRKKRKWSDKLIVKRRVTKKRK